MSIQPDPLVTRLIDAASRGDTRAAEDLLPLVYNELRKLAQARLAREAPGRTLQPTALVHEAYLRLVGRQDSGWEGRGHFFAAAARAMRHILVEQARRRSRIKRGGEQRRVEFEEVNLAIEPPADDLLALDESISVLEVDNPRQAMIVNLRCFAGMTNEEIADVLGTSLTTVEREWRYIKRWLYMRLRPT